VLPPSSEDAIRLCPSFCPTKNLLSPLATRATGVLSRALRATDLLAEDEAMAGAAVLDRARLVRGAESADRRGMREAILGMQEGYVEERRREREER
jgi:hypothetical protein